MDKMKGRSHHRIRIHQISRCLCHPSVVADLLDKSYCVRQQRSKTCPSDRSIYGLPGRAVHLDRRRSRSQSLSRSHPRPPRPLHPRWSHFQSSPLCVCINVVIFHTKFIIFLPKFIDINAKFIDINARFIDINAKFIDINAKFIDINADRYRHRAATSSGTVNLQSPAFSIQNRTCLVQSPEDSNTKATYVPSLRGW